VTRYPLSWPEGWPRTTSAYRLHGKFGKRVPSGSSNWKRLEDLTVTQATQRVLDELERMGIEEQDTVISTNVRVRLDGLPRSGERAPEDPGVAVYWEDRKHNRRVIAIDLYKKVQDNLAAIAATLDALRAVERHGGARILDRAFTGFTALPAPGETVKRTWREVFEIQAGTVVSADTIKATYRRLAAEHHPDRGGSHALMSELNQAHEEARLEVGNG
jgi:hypothetical protein